MHIEFQWRQSRVITGFGAIAGLLGLLLFPVPGMAVDPQPVEVIRSATEKVLTELSATPQIRSDPQQLNAVIQRHILPHVDLPALSRLTLGKNWRAATQEQRSRFAREFGELLVNTYSTALGSYTSQEVEYLSSSVSPEKRRATVRTRIVENGLAPLAVDYSLRLADDAWRVYDVAIEGVSLAINYRTSFAQAIRDHGIEGLIERLAARNQDAQLTVPLTRTAEMDR